MNFTAARALFDLPTGISRIEIKVEPATDGAKIATGRSPIACVGLLLSVLLLVFDLLH